MELKNYLKRKPRFFIVLGITFILTSCSSARDFNSNNAVSAITNDKDYQNFFDSKALNFDILLNCDDLYFTDLNTYKANYFGGRSLFEQYRYIGRGNRLNNVTIDNTGINIYSNFALNSLGRTNWAWTSSQLQSWGWLNEGWHTPWKQKGWRSLSNSWNGPIWNYWGWDGDLRVLLLMDQNKQLANISTDKRFGEQLGKRHSVYQNTRNNKVYRSKTRTRPNTKKESIKYAHNNLTETNNRSNSKSSTQTNTTTIRKISVRKNSNNSKTSSFGNNSKKTLRN